MAHQSPISCRCGSMLWHFQRADQHKLMNCERVYWLHSSSLVDALSPWLEQMVIIGGWAHRLYRLHHFAQPLDYEPLATFDTHVAVPVELARCGEGIRERLVANGFTEELL